LSVFGCKEKDGPGSQTVFNGPDPTTDIQFTRARRYIAGNLLIEVVNYALRVSSRIRDNLFVLNVTAINDRSYWKYISSNYYKSEMSLHFVSCFSNYILYTTNIHEVKNHFYILKKKKDFTVYCALLAGIISIIVIYASNTAIYNG
jgi:hypothetical protein